MTLHLRTRWHEHRAKRRMTLTDHMRVLWWRSLAGPRARVIYATSDGRERRPFLYVRVLAPIARRLRRAA